MRDLALSSAALLLHRGEELGCRGVGSGRAHEDSVDVVGPFVDRGRDAGEPQEELRRVLFREEPRDVGTLLDGHRLVVTGFAAIADGHPEVAAAGCAEVGQLPCEAAPRIEPAGQQGDGRATAQVAGHDRLADAAGIEFLLPIARWRGYGGETDFEGETLETISWAGGMLAATERLTAFGTVHAPLVHPIFAAKQLATLDHMSAGRIGLNIVCGWNQDEFEMFGVAQRAHDDRYAYGAEWFEVVQRIWSFY